MATIQGDTIESKFSVNLREYDAGFSRAARSRDRFIADSNRAFSQTGTGGRGGFLPGLGHISEIIQGIPQVGRLIGGLVSPFTQAAQAGIQFNMMIESAEVGFQGVAGSAENARKHVEALRKFGEVSPIFDTETLIRTSTLMNAFGFQLDEHIPKIKIWGDAIATSGEMSEEKLMGVARAFGQIRGKGRVSAEEMEQLQERGVPAWEALAKAIGKTVGETRKLAELGKLRGGPAVEAITAMLAEDPRFKGTTERLAGTLAGQLARAEEVRAKAGGLAMEQTTKDISAALGGVLQQENLAMSMAASLNTALAPVSGFLKNSVVAMTTDGLGGGFKEAFTMAQNYLPAWVIAMVEGGIIGPMLKAAGVQSPSTKTFYIGEMMALGLQEGFAQGMRGGRFSDELERIIAEAAARAGIDANLLRAMIRQESGGNARARSPKGALGVAQFMPGTGRAYGLRIGGGVDERLDPAKAIPAMAAHVRDLLNEFGGNVPQALAGYNAGAGAVKKYGGVPPFKETQNYVRSITAMLQEMGQLAPALSEYEQAKRELAGGTNWRTREGENVANLSPEQQFKAMMQLPGFAAAYERMYGQRSHLYGSRDLTGGVGTWAGGTDGAAALPFGGSAQISQLNVSGEEGVRPFADARTATFELLKAIGQIGPEAEANFNQAGSAAGSWATKVIDSGNKARDVFGITSKDMAYAFENSFTNAFTQVDQGFKGMLTSFVLGFAQTLNEMVQQWAASQLSTFLGGLFKSVLGGIGGGSAAPASLLSHSFGGSLPGRASGGPVEAGMLYKTHGLGVDEFFMPTQDGHITRNPSRGGGYVDQRRIININLPASRVPDSVNTRRASRETFDDIKRFLN